MISFSSHATAATGMSGHLLVRLVNSSSIQEDSNNKAAAVSLTVQLGSSTHQVRWPLKEEEEEAEDLVVEVPLFYGPLQFAVWVSISPLHPSVGERLLMGAVVMPRSWRRRILSMAASTIASPSGRRRFRLKDAVPCARATQRLQESLPIPGACCTPPLEPPPPPWREYWPTHDIPVGGVQTIKLAMLFVPKQPPLLDRGAGFSNLHKAALMDDARLIRFLIAHHHRPNRFTNRHLSRTTKETTPQSFTALELGAMHGHFQAVRALVSSVETNPSAAAWVVPPPNNKGTTTTCLHRAALAGCDRSLACLAEYYGGQSTLAAAAAHDAVVTLEDVQDEDGNTALMLACRANLALSVAKLVECGNARVDLCNRAGDTALLIACRHGSVACALGLLSRQPNAAAADAAALNEPEDPDVLPLSVLLPPAESGGPFSACAARPNLVNLAGERCLDRAASAVDCPELITALLACFAVPGLRLPKTGFTALHCAAAAGMIGNCLTLVRWMEDKVWSSTSSREGKDFISSYPGSAYAQSRYLTLYRDNQGRLASEVAAANGHVEVAQYLAVAEHRHLEWHAAAM